MEPSGDHPSEEALRYRVKAELRKSLQRTRALLQPSACRAKSELIRQRLRSLRVLENARTLALFRTIENKREVDTSGIDRDARDLGLRVAYPTLERPDEAGAPLAAATMKFRWVHAIETLEERGAGFAEPPPEAPEAAPGELDVVLVPALAFDASGHRIGYGAGFYDRFLPLCTRATTIGVCFDFQLIVEVPATPADVAVSVVVTETRRLAR